MAPVLERRTRTGRSYIDGSGARRIGADLLQSQPVVEELEAVLSEFAQITESLRGGPT